MSQNHLAAGRRSRRRQSQPSRSPAAIERLCHAHPALPDRKRPVSLGSAGPPYDRLAPGARRAHPLFTGGLDEPTAARSSSLAQTGSSRTFGTVGRSFCSRSPTIQGPGLASPGVPRRTTEIVETRGTFHRSAAQERWTFVQSCFGQGLSTACHQPVESTRRLFRPSSDPAALTNLRQRRRGLLCDRNRPKPARLRSGDGYPSDSCRTASTWPAAQPRVDT